MSAVIVEIRAAEGGEDAKLLVQEQFAIYIRLGARRDINIELVDERPGFLAFRATGKEAWSLFQHEVGGHRWQRVPPTEKRGRVQTSTITIAVLPEPTETQIVLRDGDLDFKFCRGSGNGGQHRQKTDSAVQLTHLPTGTTVRCESERSQTQNKETARAILRAKLWQLEHARIHGSRDDARRAQVGSGMRGDKRRTIRVRDDVVNDHITNRQWKFKAYTRGDW